MQNPPENTGTIDWNPSLILDKLDSWLDGALRLTPNILVALVALVVFAVLGRVAKNTGVRQGKRRGRPDLGRLLGSFARSVVLLLGFLLALTIVAPSVHPGDMVAGLGVGSVAIGFAFKDILQNWLAGLLILLRQPFEVGDTIEVDGYTGVVETIETRSTFIRTFDNQRAVIPNSQIYTEAVLVKTAYANRRYEYDIGIGYGDPLDEAVNTILEAVNSVDGVQKEPAPQVLPWDLASSWVTIRARWWAANNGNPVKVRSDVIRAVKLALDKAGIDMPFETVVNLQHDQTEEGDGDRTQQREGWPVGSGGATRPARLQAAETAQG
ncbi:MAG: mechanosensitive ion channel family protein [Planctomycetota bacterium]